MFQGGQSSAQVFLELAMLTLVPCSGPKQSYPCAAWNLYTSPLFRKTRQFAQYLREPWAILSAKHGLLLPDEVIERYDVTLNEMSAAERRAWGQRVLAHTLMRDLEASPEPFVLMLVGKLYWEPLEADLKARGVLMEKPLEGKGHGQSMQWLNDQFKYGGFFPTPQTYERWIKPSLR
jgi:hypothetical protein